MNNAAVKRLVETLIIDLVNKADTATAYRRPLIGFAAAADPDWLRLRTVAEATHLTPAELSDRNLSECPRRTGAKFLDRDSRKVRYRLFKQEEPGSVLLTEK